MRNNNTFGQALNIGLVEKIPMRLVKYFSSKSIYFVICFSFVSLLIVSMLDYVTGYETTLILFYLVPVISASLLLNKNWAIAFSILGTLLVVIVELLSQNIYSSVFIAFWNGLAVFGVFLTVSGILIVLRNSLLKEQKLARLDMVTGISNSRHFYELASIEMSRARRYKRAFTVVYVDVDNFKKVNDDMGHDKGDDLLRLIAATIKKNIRVNDIVSRVGGDEFILLFPETDKGKAKSTIETVFKKLKIVMFNKKWKVTFSAGVITCLTAHCDIQKIIKAADAQMYYAKKHGKNKIKYCVL